MSCACQRAPSRVPVTILSLCDPTGGRNGPKTYHPAPTVNPTLGLPALGLPALGRPTLDLPILGLPTLGLGFHAWAAGFGAARSEQFEGLGRRGSVSIRFDA